MAARGYSGGFTAKVLTSLFSPNALPLIGWVKDRLMSWVFNLVLVLFGNIRIDFIWILWTVWPQHLVKQTRKPRERKPDKSDRWATSPWHVWVHDFYPVTCFRCLSTTQWDISAEERIVIHLNQGQELSGRQTTDGQMCVSCELLLILQESRAGWFLQNTKCVQCVHIFLT